MAKRGQQIDELYISLGLDIARLQLDFDTAGKTVSQAVARLGSKANQIKLKMDVDLAKLEGVGTELDKLKVKQQAINQQLDIQRKKEEILAAVLRDAQKTSGKDSDAAHRAETNLLKQQRIVAQTEAEVRAVLDNYVNSTEGIYNTPDVVTTRDAVAAGRPRADVYFQRYRDGEQGRVYLKTVADALGIEQKDVITMVETNPDVLTQRIQDYAARNEGKIGGIDGSQAENITTVLKGFTGKDALLWNINQLKALTTAAVFDGMNEFNIQKYGVKPDHFVVQMADTMKSAQSLMLLGLSPSYLINNVINNTVTSIAEGVFGLMTPKQMQAMFDEMGIVPARLGETLSEFRGMDSSISSLDAMNERISEAKRTEGLLSDIRSAIRKVNRKAGVFSNISGKFEELQGKQVTATAINQYWQKTWKAGIGFQAMPEALVNRIEAQTPGMTNMIYLAVERGLNMQSITKALYGEYIHADVRSTLKDIAAEQFPGDPTVFDELFVKSGLLNQIETAFAMCSTEEERAAALNRIRDDMHQFINNLKRNEMIDRAESIKNMVESEGINTAQNIMADMAINRAQTWLLTRDEWGDLYKEIADKKYKGPERASLISALNIKQRADWESQYNYELQVLKGIMNGLGFETETNAQYIDTTIQLNNSWQDFYKEKNRLAKETQQRIQQRIERMSSAEIDSGAISVIVDQYWNEFFDETEALYKEYYQKEQEYQRKLDDIFVQGYEKATGKSGDQIAQNLANIRDIRQQMATMQQEAHSRTRNMRDNEKAEFYAKEFDPKYNALILDIERLQKANGTIIDNQQGQGYSDNDPVHMTAEQTVRAKEKVESANAAQERAIREKIGYMSKEEIKESWINKGYNEAQVDKMMAFMEAFIRCRVGAGDGDDVTEYFGPIFAMKGIIDFEENGESYLTMTDEQFTDRSIEIAEALMNDPKKRAAMQAAIDNRAKGTAVHEDGTPKILLHGGGAFSKFNDSYGGTNTGKADSIGNEKMPTPMYLTESWNAARSYRKNDSGLIWDRARKIVSDPDIKAQLFENLNKNLLKSEGDINWDALTTEQKHDIAYDLRNVVTIADAQERINRGPDEYKNLINQALELARAATDSENPTVLDAQQAEIVGTADVMVKSIVGGTPVLMSIFGDDDIEQQYKNKYASVKSTDVGGQSQFGTIHQVMLAASNPLVVDYDSEDHEQFMLNCEFQKKGDDGSYEDVHDVFDEQTAFAKGYEHKYHSLEEARNVRTRYDGIWQSYNNMKAWENHNDAVNYRNVVDFDEGSLGNKANEAINTWVVFDKHLVKNIAGNFDLTNKNFLAQNDMYTRKGDFAHYDWGNVISIFKTSDFSTMVHETAHLFRYALDDQTVDRETGTTLLGDFTKWAGFDSEQEFRYLEYRYWTDAEGFKKQDPKGYQRYWEAEEKFARGFEQYLIDGSAPTRGLKRIFKEFSRFLLSIYKNIKDTAVKDYSKQGEFVFNGQNGTEVLNINTEINGIKLRDIFDRMLAGNEIDRTPGYREAVSQQINDMAMTRTRMKPEAQQRRAMLEINQRVLFNWNSLAEAEAYLNDMKQPIEINGLSVDDVFLEDVIRYAKSDPKLNPFSATNYRAIDGAQTYGYSNIDPSKKYQFRYKIVELDDLIPSNVFMGDALPINEDYPADLQPRERSSVQSRNQIYNIAANLNPGKVIDDMKNISSGAPTIGEGNMYVEAGNGRILALQKARQDFPDSWRNYQEYLRSNAENAGINPNDLNGFESPVLVRERLGGNATDFIIDANSRDTLDYSASESAINDASNISMAALSALDIRPGEGIDTFTTEKNARAATEWLRSLPENERASYMTTNHSGDMVLTIDGKNRFMNALFASLYATSENLNIIKSISETSDSNIQALETAMKATLPEMTRAEGLIRTGSRDASFSIAADVAAAAGLLQDARKAKQNIHDYLAQQTIPGMERWTPTQALLAGFFGDARNNVRMLKDFFNVYGEEVFKSRDPNQMTLISDELTREQIIDTAIQAALDNRAKEVMNGETTVTAQAPAGPGLSQINVEPSAEYASNLKQNLQQTFNEGMAIPFDKVSEIDLKGADDSDYRKLLQMKIDLISKKQGYTEAQREYAGHYLDWRVSQRGDEPHADSPLIEDRIKRDINDLVSMNDGTINELTDLRRKGREVENLAYVPNNGIYVKQVYGFQHGEYTIAANVYVDGEFYGYLPEDLSQMPAAIEGENGSVYKTLAVDPEDPRGLVYDDEIAAEARTVIPGVVDGIEGPQAPNEFIRPGKQGTTPDIMPIGSSYEEVFNKYLDPIMAKFGAAFETAETDARTKNMNGLDLETRALIEKWLDNNVKQDMAENKYRAVKYSDMKKDAAMLNYNERYGFDPVLTILSPYQFWYTRSMWQWAKRMIDKPRWGQMYSRMKDIEEENRQEIMPSRLEGKFRIPMPWLPDWTGGGYYVDLNSQLFPFSQFGESYGGNVTQSVINAKAESILNEQYESGLISYEAMQEALTQKSGTLWENAAVQAAQEASSDQMKDTLISQFVSPNIFWQWYQKKKNDEDPGTLTSTRTGNALKTLTSGTGLEDIGGAIGDAMTLPERALRKLYGMEYNEFGSYGDQQIRKQISQMCADGEITWRQALNAMNEKSGTIWDMAADRQRMENELRVPLFAGAEAVKNFTQGKASIGDVISTMGATMLGGQLFPTGERELREMKAAKDQAYIDKANGDADAVNRWYDENPEYLTRQATYISDPEELLKFTLYNNITDIYYAQPYAQQQGIKNQLGPEFAAAILNKETRNYKAVPTQTLAEWNARIGGSTPNVGSIDVEGVERVMQYSEAVDKSVDNYYSERDQYFPGISVIQDGYYDLPKDQRKEYLEYFPQLTEYWDWNREYKNQHPEYTFWNEQRSAYYNEETCYDSYADMSEFTQQALEYAKTTNSELNETARYELARLYQKYANPNFLSFDGYIELLQNWE